MRERGKGKWQVASGKWQVAGAQSAKWPGRVWYIFSSPIKAVFRMAVDDGWGDDKGYSNVDLYNVLYVRRSDM